MRSTRISRERRRRGTSDVPTLIDSLIVTLDLDPSKFTAGQKKPADSLLKVREDAVQTRKVWEESNRRVAESFHGVTNELLGLGAAIIGVSSIADLIKQTVALDANVGRLAHNLGVSTEELSAWEGAIRQMGGSTQDADASIQSLVSAFEQIRLTGNSPRIPYFQLIGRSFKDLQDPSE